MKNRPWILRDFIGHDLPSIRLGLFYLAKGGVGVRKELEEDYSLNPDGEAKLDDNRSNGSIVKAIVVRCMATKTIFAHCRPCKGAGEQDYVVSKVVEDILWLGHTELILKGDNGRSLQALIERVLVVVRVRVQPDGQSADASEPPPGHSGIGRS